MCHICQGSLIVDCCKHTRDFSFKRLFNDRNISCPYKSMFEVCVRPFVRVNTFYRLGVTACINEISA